MVSKIINMFRSGIRENSVRLDQLAPSPEILQKSNEMEALLNSLNI